MDCVCNRLAKGLLTAALLGSVLVPARGQLFYRQLAGNFAPYTGDSPQGGLVEGKDGLLYGTLSVGEDFSGSSYGTVFRLNKDGSAFEVLWRFNGAPGDGAGPYGGLVQGSDGSFYGTTFNGGSNNLGTVFKLTNSGFNTYTNYILRNFTGVNGDGANPAAGLLLSGDGWLYGTTVYGGSNNVGTVFKLRTDGTGYTPIRRFSTNSTDPRYPYAALIQGPDGLLYGTSDGGGTSTTNGTVFRLSTNGTGLTVLKNFTGAGPSGDGREPLAGLVLDTNGTLYGVAWIGGAGTFGNVFKLSTNGTGFQVLTNLTGTAGNAPGSGPNGTLVIGTDGLLYGTATYGGSNSQGVVFRLNKNGSGYTVLYTFFNDPDNSIFDGANPIAGLVQGKDGGFYGTTLHGGISDTFNPGVGSIFSIGPRPVNDAFVNRIPLAGPSAVGTGNNLNATMEANEQPHGPATNSVWWSWSGLSNGPVTIINDGPINSIIDVYRQTTGAAACTTMPAGLVNWWAAEGSAFDSVGGAHGTLLNGTGVTTGKVGQTFSFAGMLSPTGDSRSNMVQIGASPIPPPWTAEFWVNRQDCLTNGGAVLIGDTNTALKLEQYTNAAFGPRRVGFTTWGIKDYYYSYTVPAGAWTHLVFAASTTNVALYANGALQGSLAATNINLPRGQIGNDIVGRYERPLRGLVDEVSLYNRMLSGSEIVSLYNSGTAGKCLPRIASSVVAARFENQTSVAIPDNNTSGASSPVVVSNFPGVLGKVAVSLHVNHSRDSDLRLFLISPDGTTNILSANNGSSGDYGTRCEGDTTIFDDFVSKAISAGDSPFVGSFRPSQPLSVFAGKSGAKVNGTWQLRAVDQVAGEIGSIDCWSLTLTPLEPVNRVSFAAVAGTTYYVAVSGIVGDSGPYYAGAGDITLSLRNLGLKVLSVTPTINTNTLTTTFGTLVQVGNGRAVSPGPLRLQFVAKPGFSLIQTADLPPWLPLEQILTNYNLANPSTVPPGAATNVTVTNLVCPAPTNYPTTNYLGDIQNNHVGWGVVVLLQQQIGTNWLTQDSEVVLTGVWPDAGGFGGPGGGVIRIPPTGVPGVKLSRVVILGPTTVVEGSTNYYTGEAQFDVLHGYDYDFTDTTWTSSLPSINGSGVFTPGIVTNTTQCTLTCYYEYDTTSTASLVVWVTNLDAPSLTNLVRLPDKRFQFTIKGVPGRKHVIQANTNLANPAAWTNLATVTNNGLGTNIYIDAGATNLGRRFYRAYETP